MAKVIVTGITSFVGIHLAQTFLHQGWDCIGTHSRDQHSYDGIQKNRLDTMDGRKAQLDIRDGDAVARLVAAEKPDLWIHHAGHATDYASADYALMESLAVNVQPLAALYQALASQGSGGVLITGSSMEYTASDTANRENDCCLPDSPYGLSKLAETLFARQQALRYGIPTRVARLYIPFGPLDNPRKLLSQVVNGLSRGERIKLSPCRQKRDFVAVSDLAKGYLALARDLSRGGFDIFNLCSGQALALSDLLVSLAELLKADPGLLEFGAIPMRPGEPDLSFGCTDKATSILGWAPRPVTQALRDLLA